MSSIVVSLNRKKAGIYPRNPYDWFRKCDQRQFLVFLFLITHNVRPGGIQQDSFANFVTRNLDEIFVGRKGVFQVFFNFGTDLHLSAMRREVALASEWLGMVTAQKQA